MNTSTNTTNTGVLYQPSIKPIALPVPDYRKHTNELLQELEDVLVSCIDSGTRSINEACNILDLAHFVVSTDTSPILSALTHTIEY